MRTIWKGALGFGLVNIPIKMYSATSQRRLDFDLIDRRNHARVRNKRVNEKTGEEVPYKEIVKAYKYNGEYVELTEEDFDRVEEEKNQVIQLNSFVEEEEIDEIYFKKPYYLAPEKGNLTGYGLLRDAMRRTGKVGIATVVMRGKEDLAVIRPVGDALVLQKLRFAEEVKDVEELDLPHKVDIGGKQLDMAEELINQFSTEFDIRDYKDTYTENLLETIEAKAKGKKRAAKRKMEVVPTKTKDLMAQLKASLNADQPRMRAS
ncbi:DNA end-binding protein Ku [Pontibacter ummariensis]|uniref:Non-homologous end joining protein Ku n=1 Tax=Pontibacter ummariensis TaxID=1610492 RepID=A0A239IA14_9BACT|nr:Ku protein [Pontibacter ummariensis]PRY09964.1 DNA end-binding protein Ku [Pontibacter ummariensis]SNS90415.1 DNA end-binding protein Ku [Pontibacter ummariensis]